MTHRIVMEVKSIEPFDEGKVRVHLASSQNSSDKGRSSLSAIWTTDTAPEVGAMFEVGIAAA